MVAKSFPLSRLNLARRESCSRFLLVREAIVSSRMDTCLQEEVNKSLRDCFASDTEHISKVMAPSLLERSAFSLFSVEIADSLPLINIAKDESFSERAMFEADSILHSFCEEMTLRFAAARDSWALPSVVVKSEQASTLESSSAFKSLKEATSPAETSFSKWSLVSSTEIESFDSDNVSSSDFFASDKRLTSLDRPSAWSCKLFIWDTQESFSLEEFEIELEAKASFLDNLQFSSVIFS